MKRKLDKYRNSRYSYIFITLKNILWLLFEGVDITSSTRLINCTVLFQNCLIKTWKLLKLKCLINDSQKHSLTINKVCQSSVLICNYNCSKVCHVSCQDKHKLFLCTSQEVFIGKNYARCLAEHLWAQFFPIPTNPGWWIALSFCSKT